MDNLSRGARRCPSKLAQRLMAFLAGITDERPTRARIAAALKRKSRSVEKAIAELVEIGWIICPGGGHGTASIIRVINVEAWKNAGDPKSAGDSPKSAGDSGALRALEVVLEQEQQPRKPMSVEIPPMEIQNEFGRWELNPAWIRYRDLEQRIGRASNPAAYAAAVRRKA